MTSFSTVLLKLKDEKYSKYKKDMSNLVEMKKNIMNFIENEYEEIFSEILIMLKKQFLSNIRKGAFSILEDLYTDKFKQDIKFESLFEENFKQIEEKYENNYNFLKQEWLNYTQNKNDTNYLTKYRKHCFNDSEFASHNCTNKENKFILILKNNNIEFVICSNCQKVYKSTFILCKCFSCDEEYYSEILPNDVNMELFEATWKEYHCPQMLNKKMSCIKCKSPFYLNMKTGMLNCTNKECQFISKQKRILWTCCNCEKEFTSEAKVYNPLDNEILNKIIKQTLLLKHRAHPNKLPCCKLNVFFTEFYHKKNCRGILYLGEKNDKLIIVCEQCHAVNYYERFIWTCPKCQIRFRTKDKDKGTLISTKSNEELINEINEKETTNKNDNIKKNSDKNIETNNFKDVINNDNNKENNKEINNENRNFKKKFFKKINNYNHDKIINDEKKKENKDENKEINNNDKDKKIDNAKEIINNNKNIILNNNVNKEISGDDVENIFRRNSIKAVLESPVKRRINPKTKNFYQSIRFRRHDRLKTDKAKSLNITYFEDSNTNTKKEINENKKTQANNIYNSNTSNVNIYKKKEDMEITKFEAPEKKEEIKNNEHKKENNMNNDNENKNDLVKKEKSENTKELKSKSNLNLARLNTTDVRRFIPKRRSVYMHYRELRLQNEDKDAKNNNINNNVEKNTNNNKEEKEQDNKTIYTKTELEPKNEKYIKDDANKINDNEKKKRWVFSRFLFFGNSKKEVSEGGVDNSRNFIIRHNFRRSSLQNPIINSKLKERISGEKVSSRSSSSSSSFSEKINKIQEERQSKGKIEQQKESDNTHKIENDDNNKENSKKSTKVNSKEKCENKNDNNNIEDEKENPDEPEDQEEEKDDTKGKELENKNNSYKEENEDESSNNESSSSNIKKVPGMSDHLFSHISKRINHILSTTKIKQFNLEDYTFYRRLGEGSYGVIHCLIHKKTKEKFALKKIIAYSLKKIQEFTKEFELVHICDHPNILKIYGLNINLLDQTTYSLEVLMEKGERDWDRDIKRRLQERRYYTEEELISIMRQLTSSLLFMKEKLNITHRDIKPQNVLIFEGGIYKLADFGEAKEIKVKNNLNTLRGTELYMSPALYNGLKINKDDIDHDPFKSDLFSLGFCLVYAATMNFNLLYELRNINNDDMIKKKIKENLKDNYSDKFIGIINKMVELDEKNRFDFKELYKEIEENYGK